MFLEIHIFVVFFFHVFGALRRGGAAADGGRPEFASGSPGIVRETFARPFCSRFGGGVYTQHVYT